MWKKIVWAGVIAAAGYVAYDYYRAGLHTRPEMPEGAFSLSYKSGLRAIMVGVPDMRSERTYLGLPFEVPSWYADAWSLCTAPSDAEKSQAKDLGPGSHSKLFVVLRQTKQRY
jgi:hypothetical protein